MERRALRCADCGDDGHLVWRDVSRRRRRGAWLCVNASACSQRLYLKAWTLAEASGGSFTEADVQAFMAEAVNRRR